MVHYGIWVNNFPVRSRNLILKKVTAAVCTGNDVTDQKVLMNQSIGVVCQLKCQPIAAPPGPAGET